MKNWGFNKNNITLFEELTAINNSVDTALQETIEQINKYNSGLIKFWIEEGLKPKLDSYLLRYVVPLYELLVCEQKKDIASALAIQMLSCISWRTFDNCVDTHEDPQKAHINSLLTSLHLLNFSRNNTNEKILPCIERHYEIMAEQTIIEKQKPIELNSIWKRCSIFLFAAEEICKLSSDNITLYKNYINYSGLAHDTHDYFSDISGKVISLPVHWMKELNPDEILSIHTVRLLYERVRKEVEPLENIFKQIEVEKKFPLINHLLKESWQTFHDE